MMLICFCLTLQLLNSETEHITEWLTRRSIFQPPKRVRKIGHFGFFYGEYENREGNYLTKAKKTQHNDSSPT